MLFAPKLSRIPAAAMLLAVLAGLTTLAGCVGITSASKSNSNNASMGTLAASVSNLSFGSVAAGSKSSQTLTLSNTGTAVVTISQAKVTGTAFSVTGGMTSPLTIAAGQSHAFQVQFAPTALGNVTGSIDVTSDASDSSLMISLSGTGASALSITTQPLSQSVTAGQPAHFSVVATGDGALIYQWKKNGASISGATSATYATPATTVSDSGSSFTVTVGDITGSNLISDAAMLTVTASAVAPSITQQPVSLAVIAGQPASFSVIATGTAPLLYQWKKNGAPINGATSATYTIPATTTADNSAQLTVTVTNSAGSATSSPATLTVNAATALLTPNTTSLLFGSISLGSSSILGVTFTNSGNSSVTVSNVTVSGAGFAASGMSGGQIIAPGTTATLRVTFAPAALLAVAGSVTVTSNATNSPATISLAGTGIAAIAHSAVLGWTASTSAVSGYNVYRATVSAGPYTKINSALVTTTTSTDPTVLTGLTYFYVVTAVDSSNVESAYSNEVSAVIP